MRAISYASAVQRGIASTHYRGLSERGRRGMLLLVCFTVVVVCGYGMFDELEEVLGRLGDGGHACRGRVGVGAENLGSEQSRDT